MYQPNLTQELRNPAQDYVLGNGAQEQNRLKLQADILEKWTEGFFRTAGIAPGMRVLDLGCGMGDVSLLAARLVGPTGSVIGIDRDEVIVRKARERVCREGHCANIEVISSDILEFDASSVELDLDTLVARMEAEAVAYHSQLIGPLQFGAWIRKP
jgi:ubiquinone/menaquinone biosynthesis C-methylase UbiE